MEGRDKNNVFWQSMRRELSYWVRDWPQNESEDHVHGQRKIVWRGLGALLKAKRHELTKDKCKLDGCPLAEDSFELTIFTDHELVSTFRNLRLYRLLQSFWSSADDDWRYLFTLQR